MDNLAGSNNFQGLYQFYCPFCNCWYTGTTHWCSRTQPLAQHQYVWCTDPKVLEELKAIRELLEKVLANQGAGIR